MSQEIKSSPIFLRAHGLQNHGIIVNANPKSLEFGEPVTDEFGTPLSVSSIENIRDLEREMTEWSAEASRYFAKIDQAIELNRKKKISLVSGFGIAAVLGLAASTLPENSPLGWKALAESGAKIMAGLGCLELMAYAYTANNKKPDVIAWAIAVRNQSICIAELEERQYRSPSDALNLLSHNLDALSKTLSSFSNDLK